MSSRQEAAIASKQYLLTLRAAPAVVICEGTPRKQGHPTQRVTVHAVPLPNMSLCLLYFLLLLLCRLINMDTQHEQGRGHTQGLAWLQGAARTQVNIF
jgi:hypothetical protein